VPGRRSPGLTSPPAWPRSGPCARCSWGASRTPSVGWGSTTQPPTGDLAVAQFVYLRLPRGSQAWVAELVGAQRRAQAQEGPGQGRGREWGWRGVAEGEEVLLPGLCVLLEVWLREVVSMRFRDTCTEPVQLSAYFDSPGVLEFLEKLSDDKSKGPGLGSFLGGEAGAVGTRIVSGQWWALRSALEMLPQVPSQIPLPSLGPFPGTTSPASGGPDPWAREGQQGSGGWNALGGPQLPLPRCPCRYSQVTHRARPSPHARGTLPLPRPSHLLPGRAPPPPPAPESPATAVNPYASKPFEPVPSAPGGVLGGCQGCAGPGRRGHPEQDRGGPGCHRRRRRPRCCWCTRRPPLSGGGLQAQRRLPQVCQYASIRQVPCFVVLVLSRWNQPWVLATGVEPSLASCCHCTVLQYPWLLEFNVECLHGSACPLIDLSRCLQEGLLAPGLLQPPRVPRCGVLASSGTGSR